ncbi:hypothetical protein V8C34DRAFT_279202 [Trichoderma compactum]
MDAWPVTVCNGSPELIAYYKWPTRRLDVSQLAQKRQTIASKQLPSCSDIHATIAYPRPNACRKSTAARVGAAVLIRAQLRDRGKGPSLTARQLKRRGICSYEALRTQVTLLRKVHLPVFGPM